MTTQTPLLMMNLWDAGITQPDLVVNDALRKIDVLLSGGVASRTTDAEPGSPAEGDAYIITGSATGTNWSTFDENDIAYFSGGAWVNYPPSGHVNVMVTDESNLAIFWTGSAWAALPTASVSGDTSPQLGGALDTNSHMIKWSKGADVASASELPVLEDGNYFVVTGTTAITSITELGTGVFIGLQFAGILTLTHHATDLVLPTGANITTAPGDIAWFMQYAAGDWRCVGYLRADGTPLTGGGGGGGMTALFKAENYTLSADELVYVDTDAGAYTQTLPASPSTGDKCSVWDAGDNAGTNNITVARNGSTIGGLSSDAVINLNGGRMDFMYTGTTWAYSYVIPAGAIITQSDTGETTGFTAGTGTGVNDDSTFTGNLGSTAYNLNDIVKALKTVKVLAE